MNDDSKMLFSIHTRQKWRKAAAEKAKRRINFSPTLVQIESNECPPDEHGVMRALEPDQCTFIHALKAVDIF